MGQRDGLELVPPHPMDSDEDRCPYCGSYEGELEDLDQALADAVEACRAKNAILSDVRDLVFRLCGARNFMEFRRVVESAETERFRVASSAVN